ncbi:MAG: hypothetical protein ACRDJH_13375 [Thermomicrobiales bacterium]
MIDSRVLQVGMPTSAGGNRVAGSELGLVAGLLRGLTGRGTEVTGKGFEATDRELASLASETPARRFELGKSQALALKSGLSGSWVS